MGLMIMIYYFKQETNLLVLLRIMFLLTHLVMYQLHLKSTIDTLIQYFIFDTERSGQNPCLSFNLRLLKNFQVVFGLAR